MVVHVILQAVEKYPAGRGARVTRARAVVIGAGIGGLAAASGLRLAGWDVIVCERAASLSRSGLPLRWLPTDCGHWTRSVPGTGSEAWQFRRKWASAGPTAGG